MKGQTEMVGLIMIVIIMGLIIVFSLVFAAEKLQKGPQTIDEPFGESVLSKNFLTVLSNTYVPACRADFQTVLKNCMLEEEYGGTGVKPCMITPVSGADGIPMDNCRAADFILTQILQKTLNEWNLKYNFYLELEGDKIIRFPEDSDFLCGENDAKESPGTQFIPLVPKPGHATLVLEICRT